MKWKAIEALEQLSLTDSDKVLETLADQEVRATFFLAFAFLQTL